MGWTVTYYSPVTPDDPVGFSIDLTTVPAGEIDGFVAEAELGAVGSGQIAIEDPNSDVGHNGDGIVGLKQLRVTESAAPAGRRRISTHYIADRDQSRGGRFFVDAEREIVATLQDLNAFLSFRVLGADDTSAFNRPAETDVQRVQALLAVDFLSTTLFDGLVSTDNPVNMDANDYGESDSRPVDVLNDCAQQSGKNFFVIYDEDGSLTGTAGQFALFYDFNESSVYTTTMRVTNVLEDVDDSTTFGVGADEDAELTTDPSRVISGVKVRYANGSVYRTEPSTAVNFGWRDGTVDAPSVKTEAVAAARGDRYLLENSTEDKRLTFEVVLPAAHVNDWRAGELGQVRFSHLSGLVSYTGARALQRTVSQTNEAPSRYKVRYECCVVPTAPQGAFAYFTPGFLDYATPTLRRPTTPGNWLLCFIASAGVGAGRVAPPQAPTFYVGGAIATPQTGWTTTAWQTANSTDQFGGPGDPPGCGIAWRVVQPGEITTTPTIFRNQTSFADDCKTGVWMWEIPAGIATPTSHTESTTDTLSPSHLVNGGTYAVGSALTGFVFGGFAVQLDQYGGGVRTAAVEGTTMQSTQGDGDPATLEAPLTGGALSLPWAYLATIPTGGTIRASVTSTPGNNDGPYNWFGIAGAAVAIPGLTSLPQIPWPANQV